MSKRKTLKMGNNEPGEESPEIEQEESPEMRGKQSGKNIRSPIGQEAAKSHLSKAEKLRMVTGPQFSLDSSFYENLPEYQDMQMFKENDENGQVERWLALGAILIKRQSNSAQHFKGFTDRGENEWVSWPVGAKEGGGVLHCFLLAMTKEDYYTYRIEPDEKRNKAITDALTVGKTEEEVMTEVKGMRTYAPNNPVGTKRGYEEIDETHSV